LRSFVVSKSALIALLCLFSILASPLGMLADADPPELDIYDVQYPTGSGSSSPYRWQDVTVTGVVTAVFYDGFFIFGPII